MTHYLMTCGHISSAIDEIGDPVCPICMCWEIKSELHDDTTGLEGREAHCVIATTTALQAHGISRSLSISQTSLTTHIIVAVRVGTN